MWLVAVLILLSGLRAYSQSGMVPAYEWSGEPSGGGAEEPGPTAPPSKTELAGQQLKMQEQQRLFQVVPNFRVGYHPDLLSLNTKQKFGLAWQLSVDPVTFGLAGTSAGFHQWRNDWSGYGQGAEGYAKRYGAAYANFFSRTMLGSAVLPSVFRQDPRYFYKGTGSKKSRLAYAISRAVIRRGDNGAWQPNYSGVLSSFASSWVSNIYYPAGNRNGIDDAFENIGINIGADALKNVLQEFFFKKWTSRPPAPGESGSGSTSR